MHNHWKAAIFAFSALMASGLTACAQGYGPDGYDNGSGYYGADPYAGAPYAGDPRYDGDEDSSYAANGYCDEYGCPEDYWDLPVYDGSIYYDGAWLNGPLFTRDWYGTRQYWVHGGWRADQWRGARPSWWHSGHYGSALGRAYFDRHGIGGARGGAARGWNHDSGRDWQNRGGNRDGFGARGGFTPQAQPRGYDRGDRDRGGRKWSGNRGNFAPQAQPQPQAQAQPRAFEHGSNRGWGSDRGWNGAAPTPQNNGDPHGGGGGGRDDGGGRDGGGDHHHR